MLRQDGARGYLPAHPSMPGLMAVPGSPTNLVGVVLLVWMFPCFVFPLEFMLFKARLCVSCCHSPRAALGAQ